MGATTQNVVGLKYAATQKTQPLFSKNSTFCLVQIAAGTGILAIRAQKMRQRSNLMPHCNIDQCSLPARSLLPTHLPVPGWDASLSLEEPMATDIDLHVGKRLRRRRRLLGLTQQELASQVGVRFQQIQKYECGANRITSGRLFDISCALNVKVQYFFDGLTEQIGANVKPANDTDELEGDILSQKETLELVRAYYRLSERSRRRLLELAKALEMDAAEAAS